MTKTVTVDAEYFARMEEDHRRMEFLEYIHAEIAGLGPAYVYIETGARAKIDRCPRYREWKEEQTNNTKPWKQEL